MDDLTPNQIAELEASKAALDRLKKEQPGLSTQRPPVGSLSEILGINPEGPWTQEDHAWAQGWHDGYYVKPEQRKCPFSDCELAKNWQQGITMGEISKGIIEEPVKNKQAA